MTSATMYSAKCQISLRTIWWCTAFPLVVMRCRSSRPFIDRTGPRASVGSCQAWAVFIDAGLPVTTQAFDEANRVDDLLQRARAYFLAPDRAPWILTFSNHVRLVVGFIDDPNNPQLILVDPSWRDVRGVVVLDRSELRAQKYEVMYLDE